MAEELLPCPFCTNDHTGPCPGTFVADQGDKWGRFECGGCGAHGPEVLTGYDVSQDAPWHAGAIAAWNERASPRARAEAAATPGRWGVEDGGGKVWLRSRLGSEFIRPFPDHGLAALVAESFNQYEAALTASRQRAEEMERERDQMLGDAYTFSQAEAQMRQERNAAIARAESAERELSHIDAVLARRPALDKPTRAANIKHAIATAARADAAERERDQERAARERVRLDTLREVRDFLWHEPKLRAYFITVSVDIAFDKRFGFHEMEERVAAAPCPPNAGATEAGGTMKQCQSGDSDVCLASRADGVICPEESCDIDDGVRKAPPPRGEGEG